MSEQQLHFFHVTGLRGAQKGRCASSCSHCMVKLVRVSVLSPRH
jgi:hypothetical protein